MKKNYYQEKLYVKMFSPYFLFLALMFLCLDTIGQNATIVTGVVQDDEGSPLIGATVKTADGSTGSITDVEGRYQIALPTGKNEILYTYIGFEEKVEPVNGRSEINISLNPKSDVIEDIIVVGFGEEKKKESVVSAITTIRPEDLKTPSSNLTTALAGRAAGVISYQRSGEPGQDNAQFFIRGVTTFGANIAPLLLVDNVEITTQDFANIVPDDIESFSILKDATATSIYGARGANGVILVTTKKGREGKPRFSFRIEGSSSQPTEEVDIVDPVTYMKMHREAVLTRDRGGELQYSLAQIDNTVPGADPYEYPQTNWKNELLKRRTFNQRANMSVSGGGKVARYMVSGALNLDNGLLKVPEVTNYNNNISLKNYNLRSNVDVSLSERTQLIVRLNGNFTDYKGPLQGGADTYNNIVRTPQSLFPAFYEKTPSTEFLNHILFGNSSTRAYVNPYAELVKGYRENSRSNMYAQLELSQELDFLAEGLKARGLFNTTRNAFYDVSRRYSPFYYEFGGRDLQTNEYNYVPLNRSSANDNSLYPLGEEFLDFANGPREVSTVTYVEAALNYNKTLNEIHNLSAMTVFTMRNRLKSTGVNAGIQASLPFRNTGLSGRFSYAYSNRYFTEFNFGYNGSERFHESNRFGFFPSIGAGWNISNEAFWEPMLDVVSNFKIRGSYGVVGNDAIGNDNTRFQYLSRVSFGNGSRGYRFGDRGNYFRPGVSIDGYANEDITWEKGFKTNLGIEVGLFESLNVIVDIFKENREDIFMPRADIPTSMGIGPTIFANIGEYDSKGVDVQMKGNKAFLNGTWIEVLGNFTYATGEFAKYEEPVYNEPWRSRIGYPSTQQWGYIAERLFIDDDEVFNSPEQQLGNDPVLGGDIKYKDVNGDGVINNIDQVPIGKPTSPEINYGAGVSTGHKSFDISVFFQGSGRSSFWINPVSTHPFISTRDGAENQVLTPYAESYWSEDNRDLYALWPRLSTQQIENNTRRSTWFMRDGSFLRLKQAEIGYSLPRKVTNKLKINRCRFYANGTNLVTFSRFKLWDVEMAGDGLGYPNQRVLNAGINLGF